MKNVILILLAILPYMGFAQNPGIAFAAPSHNFGVIPERGGKVTHDFVFRNTGNVPLILTNVRSGCGCTTSEWNRKPVPPGATGVIRVHFDPIDRPGTFIKSIAVHSNASTPVVSLTVRGKVAPQAAGPYDAYKESFGDLRATAKNINLGTLTNTQTVTRTIEFIQTADHPVTLSAGSDAPWLSVSLEPTTLQKDGKATLTFRYDPAKKNDWGFVTDKIALTIDGQPAGDIRLSADIREDFSHYNGNYADAPLITLPATAELSGMPKNSEQTHEFYIQNTGKSDLLIRKIQCSDRNTSVQLAKHTVKPGKKVKAVARFRTGNTPQTKRTIQFTTNDPQTPTATYTLNCKTR